MQTFLPYPSFARSARVLDDRRLGKQRVEVLQVLRALHFPTYGWRNHPAVQMWRGHVPALVCYGEAICDEWAGRGWADRCATQISEFRARGEPASMDELRRAGALPPWIGSRAFHRSHQSALIQKDPGFYRPRFPHIREPVPYVWPQPGAADEQPAALTAWVLRPDPMPGLTALQAGTLGRVTIALPEDSGHLTRKRRAHVEDDLTRARPGDPVVMPRDDELWLGVLERVPSPGRRRARVRLEIRWLGRAPRASLLRPGLLQDPRPLFALRGDLLPEPR